MKTSWETKDGKRTSYVHVETYKVIVGEHYGSGHIDNAGTCTHAEFLKGRYQDEILAAFGRTTLNEVIAAVENADKNPHFKATKDRVDRNLAYIMAVPEAPELERIHRHSETENGYFQYGNAGGYKTELESTNVTLFVESRDGFIADATGRRHPFQLKGHCSAVVERLDHFFLIHSDHFAEIGPDGNILFDTRSGPTEAIFGDDLRLKNCYRNEDTIFVAYWWFGGMHPDGLLRYESGAGFTGRLLLK